MKLIIAGSRTLDLDPESVRSLIYAAEDLLRIDVVSQIITGDAAGVDAAARSESVRSRDGLAPLELHVFKAAWGEHGRAAGPIRNAQMAEAGDALLLIWDGQSRGSASMKREAEKRGRAAYSVAVSTTTNTRREFVPRETIKADDASLHQVSADLYSRIGAALREADSLGLLSEEPWRRIADAYARNEPKAVLLGGSAA